MVKDGVIANVAIRLVFDQVSVDLTPVGHELASKDSRVYLELGKV
jgi:hypothetical protein